MLLYLHEGLLCLKAGAKRLTQRHLTKAVQLFSELDEKGHEVNFITVLLELGQHYVKQQQLDYGKGCCEWALLLAINANLLDCKCVTQSLTFGLFCTMCKCCLYFAV